MQLEKREQKPNTSTVPSKKPTSDKGWVVGLVIGGVFLVGLVGVVVWRVRKRNVENK